MSVSLAEKLEPPVAPKDDVARMSVKALKTRWGVDPVEDWRRVEIVAVRRPGEALTEIWSRVGRGASDDALFELIERRRG